MYSPPLDSLSPDALRTWVLAKAPTLPSAAKPLLLAVSGGLDSMTLWHLVHAAGLPHAVSHVHYGLRGPESRRERDLVLDTAGQRGIHVYLAEPDFPAGPGLQRRARDLRRKLWENLLPMHAAVLLAHHANDQLETILMSLARGTGPQGLAGMSSVAGAYLRPLLGFTRGDLAAFAKTLNLEFAEDSSNASLDYTRNHLRHEVLAPLAQVEPRVFTGCRLSAKHQAGLLDFARAQVAPILARAAFVSRPALEKGSFHHAADLLGLEGPYQRTILAEITGLEAFVGLWLGSAEFSSHTLEAIAAALLDGKPHRRRFHNNTNTKCCVVAGKRVWIDAFTRPD